MVGLFLQLGSADPKLATRAIKALGPKHFSVHAGMGAALLSSQPLLHSILRAMVKVSTIGKNTWNQTQELVTGIFGNTRYFRVEHFH